MENKTENLKKFKDITLCFIDIESDGLSEDSDFLEASIIFEESNGELRKFNLSNIGELMNNDEIIYYFINEESETILIVWHEWMIRYLTKNAPGFMSLVAGRFRIFHNIYSYIKEDKKSRYKLSDITFELTGREHQGNAKNDVEDLRDSYHNLRR